MSASSSTGKVPWRRTELNLWIKTLIRWNKNCTSSRSPVRSEITIIIIKKSTKLRPTLYHRRGERYDVGLKGGQIGNHQWAFDWHHDLWPWMTLNRPSSRSLKLQSNISITVYGMQQHWADTRSIERISRWDKQNWLLVTVKRFSRNNLLTGRIIGAGEKKTWSIVDRTPRQWSNIDVSSKYWTRTKWLKLRCWG